MSYSISPSPVAPQRIVDAALSGELVVFVGAGISRLINCPSWDNFANKALAQLVRRGIDYYDLSQVMQIRDPKKRLSIARIVAGRKQIDIDYESILTAEPPPHRVYDCLNSLQCTFVTTNYDRFLSPLSKHSVDERQWRFVRRDDLLRVNLDDQANVIHLHGCVNDPSSMVITTHDYLDHYSSREVQDFLTYLFGAKTVLFLGYGLEEIEILEYVLKRTGGSVTSREIKRFVLDGFFNAETTLIELLSQYYLDSFATELIPFPKDHENYHHQVRILEDWAKQLRFGGVTLTDAVTALEDEIRG